MSTIWVLAWPAHAAVLTVSNTGDSGPGSLRQAILDGNASPGADVIRFSLPGPGPYVIRPTSSLPENTGPVVIDGTTQPGFAGQPILELNGSLAGAFVNGLTLSGGNSTVRGLVINGFYQNGIHVNRGANNVIEGNFIGTDVSGTISVPNGYGIWLKESLNNRIGGTNAASRNIISGNSSIGIEISVTTLNTRVEGNFIGTDVTGTLALGNGSSGITIVEGSGNVVGGTLPGARNVISGNTFSGVEIGFTSGQNVVEGNFIGTDVTGQMALGNSAGILVDLSALDTRIGGTNAGSRNVISGNRNFHGVVLRGSATGTRIQGNYIGTDRTGTAPLGNASGGIILYQGASSTLIGGTAPGAGNLISGNSHAGIEMDDFGTQFNVVEGNLIGTDVTGTLAMPNGGGVLIDNFASDNRIGGATTASRNVLSGNNVQGVSIRGSATYNTIQGNHIGVDITGTLDVGNASGGMVIESGENFITGNLVSGNDLHGIELRFGAYGNRVEGNLIGTDAGGTNFLGNEASGVLLDHGASDNTIGGTNVSQRNVISGNGLAGVAIEASNTVNNRVLGNFIGTDITGTKALGNGEDGIFLFESRNNTIGGTAPGARNIISGNGRFGRLNDGRSGIEIWSGASGNSIQGNYIGTDVTGAAALPNREHGVFIQLSPLNTVGNGNLISGNTLHGVYIEQSASISNNVQGNRIGTDAAGTIAVPNGGHGIYILDAPSTGIGNVGTGRNVISGNSLDGVLIDGPAAANTRIRNNYIGLDITGTNALGNGGDGVHLRNGANRNTIGFTAPTGRNIISGNHQHGIHIEHANSFGNQVQGNFIGTDVSGARRLGNIGSGVRTSRGASTNTIGGGPGAARNTIAFNRAAGVHLRDGTQNLVRNNSIFGNGALGINLGLDAVTLNDPGDADAGANNLQNFPALEGAIANADGSTTVTGRLESLANTPFTLEFFASADCDPSGYGQGALVLGTSNLVTDATGAVNFSVRFTNAIPAGWFLTATAIDPAFNSSEFSRCAQVVPPDGGADLAIAVNGSPTNTSVGLTVRWLVSVTNAGPGNANGATATISMPAGMTFLSVVSSQGTCVQTASNAICQLGALPSAGSAVVTVEARADAAGTWVGNASVLVTSGDPNLSNNALPLSVTATAAPRLVMEPSGNGFLLSWTDSGYTLYCATNLASPISWHEVTNAVEEVEGRYQIRIQPAGGNKFFRLWDEH